MSQNMPGGIRPETVRLLADIFTKASNGNLSHGELEAFSKRQNPFKLIIDWAKVYEVLGMSAEYAEFVRANAAAFGSEHPTFWVVPVLKGVTYSKVLAVLEGLMGIKIEYRGDPVDITKNNRDPNEGGSYIVSFVASVEADSSFKDFPFSALDERGVKGITVLERLILELGYFLATGEHLDRENFTVCNGSRFSNGAIPAIKWFGARIQKLSIGWVYISSQSSIYRVRVAVSVSVSSAS
jgi:hypothetical protein